jgi:hypothetical protein
VLSSAPSKGANKPTPILFTGKKMNADQYKAERGKFDALSEQTLKDLANWAEQQALPWLWAELAGILPGRRTIPLNSQDAIRQGLQTTSADREKMPLDPNFYVAQITMLDAELKRYCGAVARFTAATDRFAPNAAICTIHGALKECLDHGIIILTWITRRISKPRRLICIGKTRMIVSAVAFAPCCFSAMSAA